MISDHSIEVIISGCQPDEMGSSPIDRSRFSWMV
jgi:hypothetical protein